MSVLVKICGLNSPDAVRAAAEADFAGFVFYSPSPRNVTPAAAAELAAKLPREVKRVALTVDPDDSFLRHLLHEFRPDLIQFHGKEPPERVAAIKRTFGIPVMKAIAVHDADDLRAIDLYRDVVDWLLFDGKPPTRAGALPGGNAASFDWTLLGGRTVGRPWMLSGGLTAANVGLAVRHSGAGTVDVSSGVENRPGDKNVLKIKEFIKAARAT
jgi:phosphoribosylanthranilate isomerase